MTTETLTARAARWCESAGIPPPDEVETPDDSDRGVALSWWLPGTDDFDAECHPDGSFYWESWWRWEDREGSSNRSSASLIAAIKEAMA